MAKDPAVEFYDQIAPSYDARYENPYDLLYDDVTWAHLEAFLSADQPYLILDAGSGTGYCGERLAKAGHTVVAVDISLPMLRIAERRFREMALSPKPMSIQADIADLDMFRSDTFDLVICQGSVLSCCQQYIQAIREFARVVKVGGYVNVSVHQRFGWVEYLLAQGRIDDADQLLAEGEFDWREPPYPAHRLHTFTVRELSDAIAEAGLEVTRIIGKLVAPRSSIDAQLQDPALREHLLRFATLHAGDPGLVPSARYVDVLAVKPSP